MGFPGSSVVKNPPTNAGNAGLVCGLGKYYGEGNSNALHYSCLGNPTDSRVWWATIHEVAKKLDMT